MTDRAPAPLAPPEEAEPPVCRTCREPIRPGALKCTHCDSYQDWRRWLGSGGRIAIVLSALTALVAVVGTVGPPLYRLMQATDSDLEIARSDLTPTGVVFAVRNSGNRDGLLSRAAFHLAREAGRECSGEAEEVSAADLEAATNGFPLFPPDRRASRIVPAGGIAELEFELRDPEFFAAYGELAAQGDECEVVVLLDVHLREFSGEEARRIRSFDAKDVFDLMDR